MENAVKEIVLRFNEFILNPILYLLVAVSVVMFFWGLVQFLLTTNSGDRQQGKSHMLWGIVGLVIIFSVWGIVNLIDGTLTTLNTGI